MVSMPALTFLMVRGAAMPRPAFHLTIPILLQVLPLRESPHSLCCKVVFPKAETALADESRQLPKVGVSSGNSRFG